MRTLASRVIAIARHEGMQNRAYLPRKSQGRQRHKRRPSASQIALTSSVVPEQPLLSLIFLILKRRHQHDGISGQAGAGFGRLCRFDLQTEIWRGRNPEGRAGSGKARG